MAKTTPTTNANATRKSMEYRQIWMSTGKESCKLEPKLLRLPGHESSLGGGETIQGDATEQELSRPDLSLICTWVGVDVAA